ncbi:MAG: helix-turn-helix transcriptional regulator [Gemmatimonadetes bacterium]|nr:helix-turn-helix transcriptional regulator [Gemmatimonadota bacterium]
MAEKSFDQATIAEIVRRANLTAGAFYARFVDKDALLRHLEERLENEIGALFGRAYDVNRWEAMPPVEVMGVLIGELVHLYNSRRAVLRALVLRSHSDPQLKQRLRALTRDNLRKIVSLVATGTSTKHENPELALEFCLLAIQSVLREAILFRETWRGGEPLPESVLTDELTRLVVSYLNSERISRSRHRPR